MHLYTQSMIILVLLHTTPSCYHLVMEAKKEETRLNHHV